MDEQHPNDEGYAVVLGKPDFSMCVGLHVHPTHDPDDAFAEQRTGLDHVAWLVSSRAELEDWRERLADLGVEHSPINKKDGYAVLVFRDPDNVQLEFFAMG